uniref:uncharacterized protein LOC122582351 n=1 Tax=Erigeron canadensis TaxID=72917 RepID=UPI001CB9CE4F|nr:uncharacterized protein LOC122582351 [Erigeron canadensis]
MGKSIPFSSKLQDVAARIITSDRMKPQSKRPKPVAFQTRVGPPLEPAKPKRITRLAVQQQKQQEEEKQQQQKQRLKTLAEISNRRIPLSEVVSDCSMRWFGETLLAAENGDVNMQVLVGQMYYSGYGTPKDAQKGREWIKAASRSRSSVWKVGYKPPGYNASDSDSDEVKTEGKQT